MSTLFARRNRTLRRRNACETEEWRPVVGYEGIYAVSSLGRIKSMPRRDCRGQSRGGFCLKAHPTKPGRRNDLVVGLSRDRKTVKKLVSHIVAEAFIGPAPGPTYAYRKGRAKPGNWTVNHKNLDHGDNRASNLEWVTARQNRTHAEKNGGLAHGEAHPHSRLTREAVRSIYFKEGPRGDTHVAMAERHGVSAKSIFNILSGRTWRHVTGAE